MRTRELLGAVVALLLLTLTVPALAHHVDDGGVDEVWDNSMNQESYWETRFATETRTVECTKYSNHNGHIPAKYDAAVVKDGNMVRVYADLTEVGAFTALGAVNPANDKHFDPPHSWVMKCTFEDREPEPDPEFTTVVECRDVNSQVDRLVVEITNTGEVAFLAKIEISGLGDTEDTLDPGESLWAWQVAGGGPITYAIYVDGELVDSGPYDPSVCVEDTTTTTVPETTTTTVEVEDSTTTTTVVPPPTLVTTTTQPEDTSTTVPTTDPGDTTTTIPGTTPDTLPFTGMSDAGLGATGLLALISGAGLAYLTRKTPDTE